MRKLISRPEGFTLIELMIVILIIAILVAIAVPVYLNAKSNAQKRTCQANLRTVDSAVQSYEATMPNGDAPTGTGVMLNDGTKVLKATPTCPGGGSTVAAASYAWISTTNPPSISCPYVAGHSL